MILALDVGNSQIFGGVFEHGELTIRFRKPSRPPTSSDELGLFLRGVLRENGGDPAARRADRPLFGRARDHLLAAELLPEVLRVDPFILQAGVKTGLKIRYRNPLEVGADRIANAIAATHLYPDRNLIIVDFGTATTFDVVRAGRDYLGGIILPGLRIRWRRWRRTRRACPTSKSSRRRARRPIDGRVHPVRAVLRQSRDGRRA